MILLIGIVLFSLGTSFMCSVLEAVVLSVGIPGLVSRKNQGHKGSALLLDIKLHRVDDAISAIVTLNTIANTIGATLAGAEVAILYGDQWVGLFSGVLTFLIFVFAEIIPKTLGNVFALQLSGVVGYVTQLLTRIMVPILVVTRFLTRLISAGNRKNVTRGEISALVSLAGKEGTLSKKQVTAFTNLLSSETVTLSDIMTPRTVVHMMADTLTVQQMIKTDAIETFSRIPVYGKDIDDIKGYVMVKQLCLDAARGKNLDKMLQDFIRPIRFMPQTLSLGAAWNFFTEENDPIAMTVDEYGSIVGLVTTEDILETMLGIEIVDESDQEPDLRKLAGTLRDKRLSRLNVAPIRTQQNDAIVY